jgi:hypothetical protein
LPAGFSFASDVELLVSRVIAIACLLVFASCATQPAPDAYASAPGFFMGFLHGLIAPLALIAGIFSDVRIYAFPNSGGWYDFGFVIGIWCWIGGAARS